MRVTAEKQAETRAQILLRAQKILAKKDFSTMTTRDIASAAGIAAGTLFNYFPTKEAVLLTLIGEALDRAVEAFPRRRRGRETLVEDLFLFITTGLKQLRAHRDYLTSAIELLVSPFESPGNPATRIRQQQLSQAAEIFRSHGIDADDSFVTLQLYWTLYVGVLSFWARDNSPNDQDTLVLLDRSLQLLVASFRKSRGDR